VILTIGLSSFYFKNAHDDTTSYFQDLKSFDKNENLAMKVWNDHLPDDQTKEQLINVSLPAWLANKKIITEANKYKLNDELSQRRSMLIEYTDLRIRETEINISILKGENDSTTVQELSEVEHKLNQLLKGSKK
jgi:hypothetical protein